MSCVLRWVFGRLGRGGKGVRVCVCVCVWYAVCVRACACVRVCVSMRELKIRVEKVYSVYGV